MNESTLLRIRSATYSHVSRESHVIVSIAWMGTYVLVDQQNSNILSLLREVLECSLDGGGLGLGVDNEEVALRVWGIGDVLIIGTAC